MAHERPLSPHLQVYRPQITSVLSILHRITGVALTAGLFFLMAWLLAGASGEAAYNSFQNFAGHPLVVIGLIGISFALFYHLCAGIRHLLMDGGLFFTIPEIYKSGYTMIVAATILTVAFWAAYIF
ncbi:MAG: succinate dehydrogenase, cytochrome b556 subunit [Alphaproteobacteria bacterium]|nr:succinate dehydrogenase, cytochrome b556 subunit [Alphaproteobacteria bacterium]